MPIIEIGLLPFEIKGAGEIKLTRDFWLQFSYFSSNYGNFAHTHLI